MLMAHAEQPALASLLLLVLQPLVVQHIMSLDLVSDTFALR